MVRFLNFSKFPIFWRQSGICSSIRLKMASKRRILLNFETAKKMMYEFVTTFVVSALCKIYPTMAAAKQRLSLSRVLPDHPGNRKPLFCRCYFAGLTLHNTETMKVGTNLCILFLALLELSSIFLLLAISKRIELQIPDWHQKMGNSLKF